LEWGKGKFKAVPPFRGLEETKGTEETAIVQGHSASRVLMGICVSFVIKFTVEVSLVLLFLRNTRKSFTQVYVAFDLETICIFLRGEHLGLSGSQSI